jgi:hypothetical protein
VGIVGAVDGEAGAGEAFDFVDLGASGCLAGDSLWPFAFAAAGPPKPLNVKRTRCDLFCGLEEWCLGTGSEGRRASVSWTVRICFASASERVKERSHSERKC